MTAKPSIARSLFLMAALLLNAQAARAGSDTCGNRAAAIVRNAYPNARPSNGNFTLDGLTIVTPAGDPDGETAHIVCRIWPDHPELMLAAVPFVKDATLGESEGRLDLLVLDKTGLTLRQRLRLNTGTAGGQLGLRSVRFDSARYPLAPRQNAVGLLVMRGRQVDPKNVSEDALWLYAFDGNQVSPVVDGLVVQADTTVMGEQCSDTSVGGKRTLAVVPSPRSGFADIVVTEKVLSRRMTKGKDGMCALRPTRSETSTHRLVYDGTRYDVPKALLRPLE
ncbi:multidrug ABC transporter ATPase [Burkholderia lata]|uniref:hypothetical protein n=1 Tax=Burkholderia lata (strain ATCC 17760 / DSM 23089 / LMG 22485 / NCIMB 9086 / R18194 / 383) TaxID=482957 RepID=UPI00145394AE|nr:hypothetical protein [Burkholderia lata]VWD60676.1 multidrug ABC transporter ATPase [Burkholderia lata]